jgi:hypothetical protein
MSVDLATGEVDEVDLMATPSVLETYSPILGGFVPIGVRNGRKLAQIRLPGYLT